MKGVGTGLVPTAAAVLTLFVLAGGLVPFFAAAAARLSFVERQVFELAVRVLPKDIAYSLPERTRFRLVRLFEPTMRFVTQNSHFRTKYHQQKRTNHQRNISRRIGPAVVATKLGLTEYYVIVDKLDKLNDLGTR